MALKNAKRPDGDRAIGGGQMELTTNYADIIPQLPQSVQIQKQLALAHRRKDWRKWWIIYCQSLGIPYPPTGKAIKLAQLRKEQLG